MATGLSRISARGALRLSSLGRGDERGTEAVRRQSHLRDSSEDESTPLNVRAHVDFSTVFGHPEVRRKRDQKLPKKKTDYNPEDQIKLFAFRLAIIAKTATAIGTVAFIFATTVILGAFATSLAYADFWAVALILFAEALRIFTRSHELEWQLMSNWTKDSKISVRMGSRSNQSEFTTSSSGGDVESPPIPGRVPRHGFLSRFSKPWVMNSILYILGLISAGACIGLSIWRLSLQRFCFLNDKDERCPLYQKNVIVCMNVFFSMAILESSLFLLEKGYFQYRMRFKRLLRTAQRDLFRGRERKSSLLPANDLDSLIFRKFYYTVYTTCIKGSLLDALDMNLVAFGFQSLQSDDLEQQLRGARLLNEFVLPRAKRENSQNEDVDSQAEEALQRLSRTPGVIERLVEMLFWNSEKEEELVCEIASLLRCLVAHASNWSRFAVVPGALDAIVSILLPHLNVDALNKQESRTAYAMELHLQLMGVKILRYLCRSYANNLQIGETRGLMSILVLFAQPHSRTPRFVGDARAPDGDTEIARARWKIYKTSLQVLLYLASNKTNSGETTRQHIADVVLVLKNLRDTIEFCEDKPLLQVLSMEILHHLAFEDNVRSAIGATGGTIRLLFDFFRENDAVQSPTAAREQLGRSEEKQKAKQDLAKCAGKVLSRLMIENKQNCVILLTMNNKAGSKPTVQVLTESFCLGDEEIAVSAAEMLRRIMKYAGVGTKREIAARSGPQALQNICDTVEVRSPIYEVSLGLASDALRALPPDAGRDALSKWVERAKRVAFLSQLIRNLHHIPTTSRASKIRRSSVEVMISLLERDEYFLDAFTRLNLETELEQTLDTISEVENFSLFSGLKGYARHSEDIRSLVLRCMAALGDDLSST